MDQGTSPKKTPVEAYKAFQNKLRSITHEFRGKADALNRKIDEKQAEEIKKRIASS